MKLKPAITTLDKSLWSTAPTADDLRLAHDWLRDAVRRLQSARRSALTAHIATRSSSAMLRPAENLLCASAISLSSAANCILSATRYLCALRPSAESPVPGLYFCLRDASKWVCVASGYLYKHCPPLSRSIRSTAITLALAAAAIEEGQLRPPTICPY